MRECLREMKLCAVPLSLAWFWALQPWHLSLTGMSLSCTHPTGEEQRGRLVSSRSRLWERRELALKGRQPGSRPTPPAHSLAQGAFCPPKTPPHVVPNPADLRGGGPGLLGSGSQLSGLGRLMVLLSPSLALSSLHPGPSQVSRVWALFRKQMQDECGKKSN